MKTFIAIVVVAAAALGTWKLWPSGETPGKVKTKTARVVREDIQEHVTATGEIKPVLQVELKSKASGLVVRFVKEPGDPVKKDEVIVELEKDIEQRNLSLAQANLLSAEANLALTRLRAETDQKTTESELAAAKADLQRKKAELERLEELEGDLVTASDLEAARLDWQLAREKTKQVEASLALIRGRQEGDLKLAEADVLKARVALDDARKRLEDTEIRSPIDGILLARLVEEGQIVASGISATSGGTPVGIVADVSTLHLEASVDETDVGRVVKGQHVEITLESGRKEKFEGVVDLIPPQGELDSNIIAFKVRIVMKGNPFGKAKVGMTAVARILVNESKDTLVLPVEAVKVQKEKPVVYVSDGNGGSKAVPIRKGVDNGYKVEVLDGLSEDDEVFVTHSSIPGAKGRQRNRGGRS